MTNSLFVKGLIGSFILHGIVLIGLMQVRDPLTKSFSKPLEVIYQKLQTQPLPKVQELYKEVQLKEEKQRDEVEVLTKDFKPYAPTSGVLKDHSPLKAKFKLEKRQATPVSNAGMKRRVTIPILQSDKINDPKYHNYQNLARNKIKQRSEVNVEQAGADVGEVYVSFVIQSDGRLRNLKIKEDRTRASQLLKDIALKSVIESSPFPPFPNDLKYLELPFAVLIKFNFVEI